MYFCCKNFMADFSDEGRGADKRIFLKEKIDKGSRKQSYFYLMAVPLRLYFPLELNGSRNFLFYFLFFVQKSFLFR